MTDEEWTQPTTFYAAKDARGYSSVLCDDVRTFIDLPPDEAACVTVVMVQAVAMIPGRGPKQRLDADDLLALADILPGERS